MYHANIESETLENENFRKVLYTGLNMQLVVMHLKDGEEIGEEIHSDIDQFFRVEEGEAKFVIDGRILIAKAEEVVIVPAGSKHNVINDSGAEVKLYTIYAPPEHPKGTVHKTKKEADDAEMHHH